MSAIKKDNCRFYVDIRDRQNATWQGTVTWVGEKKTESFRSALELLKLIESTMTAEQPGKN